MCWTDEQIDKALMFVAALRDQRFGNIITGLSQRFQLSRDEAVALYRATQPGKS